MNKKIRVLVVIGTRPEAIKLASVVDAAKREPELFEIVVVTTSQHRDLLDQMTEAFGISPDIDLNIMKPNQTLSQITGSAINGLHQAITETEPDVVVVQGDTTSTFVGALAAFYCQVPVAHVEAGLRTYDKNQPFPEEINRRLTSQIAEYHFAPTDQSRGNLLRENIPESKVWVTGNTCIDALNLVLGQRQSTGAGDNGIKRILLTAHRRENHGAPLHRICEAVVKLTTLHPEIEVVYPMHPSPKVREVVVPALKDIPRVKLVDPMGYIEFVNAMADANIILTDSGGVQEEAPSLNKPVLVMRETTERPEGVTAGTLKLVGTEVDTIVNAVSHLLNQQSAYDEMASSTNPYGDGTAGQQIMETIYKEIMALQAVS